MTDQPTDHRAEAERLLALALTSVSEGAEGFAQAEALIGVGHYLGAILEALLAGPADAKIAAALKVVEDLDGDPEWAKRQICNALLYGRITDGAPDSA